MTPLVSLATWILAAQTGDAPNLEYTQETFVVRTKVREWRAPLRPVPATVPPAVAYRRDQSYAVWDSRGLTVRRGEKSVSTRLPDFPTSPKAFSSEEIAATIDKLTSGARTREATGLSGALRDGHFAYFLARWAEKDGATWAEGLYRIDLAGKAMRPEYVGRFDGLSVAYRPIDDRMFRLSATSFGIVARKGDTWGIAQYTPKSGTFEFRAWGGRLLTTLNIDRMHGLAVETTPYGTTAGIWYDLENQTRRLLFEGRGITRFLDAERPYLLLARTPEGGTLRNLDTGAEFTITPKAGIRRVGPYVVQFSPVDQPERAQLLVPERWSVIAEWQKPTEVKPAEPVKRPRGTRRPRRAPSRQP